MLLRYLLFICLAFSLLLSQSFFSMRGLGEEVINTDATMTALGSAVALSYQNPSLPIEKEKTVFQAGIIGSGVLGNQFKYHRFITDARPNYLKGIFVLPFDFSFGIGLTEKYNQNFNVYSDTINHPGYQRQIVGYGGIYCAGISLAKSFYKHFAIGFEYGRYFGNFQELWFFQALPSFTITTDTVTTNYRGDNLKFGFGASIKNFNLGILYEKNLPIYIDNRVLSHGVLIDSAMGLKLELPPRIGLGLSFSPLPKFAIILDYFHRQSKNIKINQNRSPIFQNSNKYSIGFIYNLDDKHPIRFGYRYYDWYFVDHTNKLINEQAITLGSGIPIPKFGSLEFALELINRKGSTLTENICRLNLTLHYEEVWKIRKRRWGY